MAEVRTIQTRLHVADLPRSAGFYRRYLGFVVGSAWPEGSPEFAILVRGPVELQLSRATDVGPSSPRTSSLWVEVEDIAAFHAAMAADLPIEWGPEVYAYGRREYAVRDPDGNLVILSEATDDPPTCPESV